MAVMSARILVVDDEENISYVVSTALRLAGFEVTVAVNGRDALSAAATRTDLLVLDVTLPDLDGFEVCRRLRQNGSTAPVIFLTARDATEDRLRGLTIGGDDYVTKPFSVEELVARVRVVLRRVGVGGAESDVVRCGDIEIDDDAHRVMKAGEEVSLSPTEYKLLRFLARNHGRVMSRAQILDHVWDYDFNGESTVVETFMSSLRKKVGGDLIHTVRGVGYRLGTP
jgi:two-component system, OmpR family, response regulator